MKYRSWLCSLALGLGVLTVPVADADELPGQLSWTAYGTGSAGYNQAVAIGSALKNQRGINLRVLPGKNDVSRQVPLRAGKVQFSATGVGASFMAQEGVFEFGLREWGPQQVRVLLASNGNSNLSIGVAADVGVQSLADLKGKRVAWVVGSPSLNENVGAILHFAGLSWDDVSKVEFPGFGASWDGIINNQVDAAFASTTSGKAYQLEASPRGIFWPPLPHDNQDGWARIQSVAPFFVPNMATIGASLSEDNPHEGAAYPYPILITYPDRDNGLVYAMTKAMVELYPHYKDAAPGINGWALERQIFDWVVPYHDGAIQYFRELGVWSDTHQQHNDELVRRQQILQGAWQAYNDSAPDDDDAFFKGWLEIRRTALEDAGLSPIY